LTESFIIPYPKTPAGKKQWSKNYGLNAYYAGKHWSIRKRDAEYWHRLTSAEMERQKVRRFPFENAVVISFYWNDRLDCSNHAIMAKMIEDAMRGRVIKDDSRRWVKGIEHYFHDNDFIKIVIREV
jgi:hypothetical protein